MWRLTCVCMHMDMSGSLRLEIYSTEVFQRGASMSHILEGCSSALCCSRKFRLKSENNFQSQIPCVFIKEYHTILSKRAWTMLGGDDAMLHYLLMAYTTSYFVSGFKRMTKDIPLLELWLTDWSLSRKDRLSIPHRKCRDPYCLIWWKILMVLFIFSFDRYTCVKAFCPFYRYLLTSLDLMRMIYAYGARVLHSSMGQLPQYFDTFLEFHIISYPVPSQRL